MCCRRIESSSIRESCSVIGRVGALPEIDSSDQDPSERNYRSDSQNESPTFVLDARAHATVTVEITVF